MRLKYILVLLAAVLVAPAWAQDEPAQHKIDSLLSLIKPDSPDSIKAKTYCEIASLYRDSDAKTKYAELSMEFCNETDYQLLALNNYSLSFVRYKKGDHITALRYMKKNITNYQQLNNNQELVNTYKIIAAFFDRLKHTDSASIFMNKALEISNQIGDTALIADCYRRLGTLCLDHKMFGESKKYYRKALVLDSLSRNRENYAVDLFDLAQLIEVQESGSVQDYFVAKNYLVKSARVFDTLETNYKNLTYLKLASIYITIAQKNGEKIYADSCYYYYKKAKSFFQNYGEIRNYRILILIHVDYLVFYKKYNEAIAEMLDIKEYYNGNAPSDECEYYHTKLKDIYTLIGDYKNALAHSEKAHEYNLELYSDSTMNALADMKTEQAMMVERINRENAEKLHAAEKRQMSIAIISLIGGMVLVLIVIALVFRVLVIRKRANDELAEQKEEIEAQRDHIEAQNKEIQASINYARRIQRALLTPDEAIASVFPDYFLLYKPRSVVSGDFYWVGQFGDNKVCIVADCTGHGVPGGFMSVLGMTNLNYIVGQDIAPEAILNKLRDAIMWNLRQNEGNPEELTAQVLDGMDVAAYVVNEKQMTLTFAGANNPLVLIRDNEVQVIKPDKMPVGISVVMKPFQSVTIELRKGDCLYTYSDGFQDQFNIETEKKFQKSRLRDLLLEIHTRPMDEQRELLNLVFKEWRGPAENQTDDVVIMGVRI